MNNKSFACYILIFFFLVSSPMLLAQEILEGFAYGKQAHPTGEEWQSPQALSLNKEQPHAYFFSFQDVTSARKLLPENSAYWQSLNGTWKFHFAKNPDERPKDFYRTDYNLSNWDNVPVPLSWNIYGVQKDGSLKYGVPIYVNQPVIFQHKVAVDDWRGGVMREPAKDWTTYTYRNEVGSFRRDFEVPANWKEREVFLNFDGVDCFFYLWINGQYVGFSKNSRNVASFNISPYLVKGKNTLAVEVYRSSDGSFLEAQDMFRLPGIFRTVALHAVPKVHIRDLNVVPDLDANYNNGSLKITAAIKNFNKKTSGKLKLVYSLFANTLYADENVPVKDVVAATSINSVAFGQEVKTAETILRVNQPNKWSAEKPYRYTLVAELKDTKGKTIETVSTIVGFRKVEIKDTPANEDEFGLAGRYYYINGKTVKLRGVNRHESHPAVGHAITRKMMEEEVMLMKRANINHVRNSHYPDDPYWYYLCDKYGIYLEDEANIESHEYYYGAASLSHPPEWKAAHVARVMEMVHANYNHPSIVIWSLGNEAGPGKNFVAAYDALKKVDASRPVQYERNNNIVDIGSNQYPSIAWMRGAVKGNYKIKYPFHVSEYAHSMGNACGNLVDYWDAMESTNHFMGGAIWDWVDQSMYNYDTLTGTKYLAYGGDFGDKPNDGQFVMNGIIFGDREPKPQYYEVKKVYQNLTVSAIDLKQGRFNIFNKFYFKDLNDYEILWTLIRDGKSSTSGKIDAGTIAPRTKKEIIIPYQYNSLQAASEYFVNIQFVQKNKQPWADKGYVQEEEQFLIKDAENKPAIATVANVGSAVYKKSSGNIQTVTGEHFEAKFDISTGSIYSLQYSGNKIIADGKGPRINALRAFVNNDNWVYQPWFTNGLHNLRHHATSSNITQNADGTVTVNFTVTSQAPNAAKILGGTSSGKNKIEELTDQKFGSSDFKFVTNQIYTVYPDGSIELQSAITSNKPELVLAKLGYVMNVPQQLENYTYYGRGPYDNYNDRETGSFIGQYESTVTKQFVNFPKPQDMANREGVRWAALTNTSGAGAVFITTQSEMAVSALPYSSLDMILASHPYQLPKAGDTYLELNAGVTGLGGNSCGQGGPLEQDRVKALQTNFGFIIRPVNNNASAMANVLPSGKAPLSIIRHANGLVEISSANQNAISYTVNNGAVQTYKASIPLRTGGEVKAWFTSDPASVVSNVFEKIETVQITVIGASSQEAGEGDATHFVDGDPNTNWHTMYSVTVAKHPHWVDFDMGETRTIKGFTYLPRRVGMNGVVKDYSLQVSNDAKNWTTVIEKNSFERDNSLKKVLFGKPITTRYIRFIALSEQNGQDFASGAEFSVLEQ
ncbi:MAG: glycoside hydrolase family 2 TIM barrel-domain containing protein [Niabella sp.]